MGSRIQCFMLEPTQRVRIKLRRFTHKDTCSSGPMQGHDASVLLPGPDVAGSWPARIGADGYLQSYEDLKPPADDPRWATVCEQCGAALPAETIFQVFQEQLYRRADTGEEVTLRDAPPGAMHDAAWDPAKGPDGRALYVCLPPNGGLNYWHVDGPSSNGPGWMRTGVPPLVTANPSILTPRYHGFLRNGWLEEC
jgi:hypothetical protein